MNDYTAFYAVLQKPFFAPPEWFFGVVWGIIYPLIILAFIFVFVRFMRAQMPPFVLGIFLINLAVNLAFTPILFGLESIQLATLDILVVWGTLVFLELHLYRYLRVAFWLLLPYLLWGTFATILQITIAFLN